MVELPYMCKEHVTAFEVKFWDNKKKCHNYEAQAAAPSGGEDAKRGEFPYMVRTFEVMITQW